MKAGVGCVLFLATLLLGLNVSTARADLTACNQTGEEIAIALGVQTPSQATSYGWWVLAPQTCQSLLNLGEASTKVYAYAEHHVVAGGWSGEETFCVATGQFEISGRDKCFARGYKPVGFFEIDMKSSQDMRYDFVDSEGSETTQ
ncbi:MAG: DUF1036 domain-containing protein [Alphaproteobacteria bacterium]|nr:MAG: DUF1036 domain-containing protein [Alphaproteobacteria bacterium]